MGKLAKIILIKKVAVVKTDTLYGLLGLAKSRSVVNRIYEIKKRNPLKPVIVLVSNMDQIRDFGGSVEMGRCLNRCIDVEHYDDRGGLFKHESFKNNKIKPLRGKRRNYPRINKKTHMRFFIYTPSITGITIGLFPVF